MVRIRCLAFVVTGLLVTVSLAMAQAEEEKHPEEVHQYRNQALKLGGYVQARWEGTLEDRAMPNAFSIRRAYFGASGDVEECFSYKVLLTMPGTSVELFDAYVDVKPIKYLSLRAGQFQTPIGMEKLTSSSVILFPERTFASGCEEFPLMDRDLGLMLAAKVEFLTAQLGIFNGEGRNVKVDLNEAKDIAARLTVKPIDYMHVGGAYQIGKRLWVDTTGTVSREWDFNRWGAEFALNPWDLWFATEIMGGRDEEVSLITYYAEAGWMFSVPLDWIHGVQPAVRYEVADPDTDADGDSRSIITAGINLHFLPKHQAKLALCYRMITEERTEVANDQIIAQLQLKFP
jgi:hypothetical protein